MEVSEAFELADSRLPEWASGVDGSGVVIASGLRGSAAHGTRICPEGANGTDDIDVFYVVMQHPEFYQGLLSSRFQCFETAGAEVDILAYDARKFMGMLVAQNVNAHQWLWTPPRSQTDAWLYVRAIRNRLLGRRMLTGIMGYARSQFEGLHKIQKSRYMGAKREELRLTYGYDIKAAAHAIRLLYVGIHLAKFGELLVTMGGKARSDVRLVKCGGMTSAMVNDLFGSLVADFRVAEANTSLPDEVPIEVFDDAWGIMLSNYF